MKKIIINSNLNFTHRKQHLEINSQEIVSEPGHAFTIKELFERAKNGMMPSINMHDQNWEDEPDTMLDHPDPTRDPDNDIIDILTIADSVETKNVEEEKTSEQSEENEQNENEQNSENLPPDEPKENDESKQ